MADYQPFPKQDEFHGSEAKYRLFGGAAGPGKTMALLFEGITQALETPGVDTLLLRRTFPELESSLITYFRRDVPRNLYRHYNESKHVVTWHNGSTTRFGYSAGENDIYQYQGAEFLFIGIDELTHFTLSQWQFLTSRNRCSVNGTRPNMAGATNPGNVGHAWVKALWIDKRPAPGMESPEQYDPADYDFIRATLDDNPIYVNDADYRKTLEALPRHMRQAFLHGDWNVYAGQYFDIFDGRHVARPEQLGIEPWWPRWISVDWGFEHPSAVYWHAARPDGVVLTYREFVANHLSPRMLAQAIAERSFDAANRGERVTELYLSPDAFARRSSELTIAEQLGDVLAQNGLPRPAPADNDRIGGWMLLYQMLEAGQWVIAENCVRLIECLPTLTRDPANVEDVLKISGDDPADSARYGLKSRVAPGRVPLEQRVAERVTAVDPTSRAIWTQKFLAERTELMPMINRRYHMNPGYGQRVERSRIADAFRGLAAQAQAHPASWMSRLMDHLTQSRSVNELPPHPKPPGMPPEAWDHMKINQLTVRQVANIVANENHDVTPGTSSPEELQRAKIAQAHTIINADRTYGSLRDKHAHTAPEEVTGSLEHSEQYKQALDASRAAFQEQLSGHDPVGGRMHFNNRPNASTALHRIGSEKVPVFGKPYGPFQRGKETVYTDIYENPKN